MEVSMLGESLCIYTKVYNLLYQYNQKWMMVSIFDVIYMLFYLEKRDEGQLNLKVESIRLNKCNIYD